MAKLFELDLVGKARRLGELADAYTVLQNHLVAATNEMTRLRTAIADQETTNTAVLGKLGLVDREFAHQQAQIATGMERLRSLETTRDRVRDA